MIEGYLWDDPDLSASQIRGKLKAEHGVEVTVRTVYCDLRAVRTRVWAEWQAADRRGWAAQSNAPEVITPEASSKCIIELQTTVFQAACSRWRGRPVSSIRVF